MKRMLALLLVFLVMAPAAWSETDSTTEEKSMMLEITVGDQTFTVTLADNESAAAFAALLPMTLDMSELNGNEKYHYMKNDLPSDPQRVEYIEAGDLMLYGGDCVVLFYQSFATPYRYTRIGRVDDVSGLREALGRGGVTVRFAMRED